MLDQSRLYLHRD